jgi:alpha-L-fucosidase
VKELAEGIRSKGLHFGLYFSEMDWFHPLYLRDKKMGTKDFPQAKFIFRIQRIVSNFHFQQVQYPQLLEIVNQYQPEVIWSDGDWEMSDDYWSARNFLAWLYNERSPSATIVLHPFLYSILVQSRTPFV